MEKIDKDGKQLEIVFRQFVTSTVHNLIEYDPKVVRWLLKMEEIKKSTGQLYLVF